jgi:hypothetical protein
MNRVQVDRNVRTFRQALARPATALSRKTSAMPKLEEPILTIVTSNTPPWMTR